MRAGACLFVLCLSSIAFAADWNPKLAAEYLDGRQQEWFAWPRAASANGPCVSCHTGMPYLLARPALRRVLGEPKPTKYETGLLDRLRVQAGAEPPGALQGIETIFAALFLTRENPAGAAARRAFDQLWALQIRDGSLAGAWPWYNASLDPWETPSSWFYGAALAALAIGEQPEYRNTAQIRSLESYFKNSFSMRPMHSRLALLWASTKLPEMLAEPDRDALIQEVLQKEQADGSWTLESLGPWADHPGAPASSDGSSYPTAFTAYVLRQAGVSVPRAVAWLKAHQNPYTGAWPAVSMNKRYPPGSMEEKFLQDAATAFAALALIDSGQ